MNSTGRNWPKTLSPASYKGFVFSVDQEALPKSGREVAKHQYVKAEFHDTEDMGRVPRDFKITAYLASDTADSDARAFIELCSTKGAGTLILPQLGTYQARCTNCHATGKKDELGRLEFNLDFIEASVSGGAPAATPLGDRLAASALAGLPAASLSVIASISIGPLQVTGQISLDYQQPTRVF